MPDVRETEGCPAADDQANSLFDRFPSMGVEVVAVGVAYEGM